MIERAWKKGEKLLETGREAGKIGITGAATYGVGEALEAGGADGSTIMLVQLGTTMLVYGTLSGIQSAVLEPQEVGNAKPPKLDGEGGKGTAFGDYSTKIDAKVSVVNKQELPNSLVKTFKDGNYRTVVTNEDITVYRSFGYNAEAGGAFATSNPALNRVQTKVDCAILPEWKNTLRYEAEIIIPKGTTLNIGRVEEQFTMSGARLAGDAD